MFEPRRVDVASVGGSHHSLANDHWPYLQKWMERQNMLTEQFANTQLRCESMLEELLESRGGDADNPSASFCTGLLVGGGGPGVGAKLASAEDAVLGAHTHKTGESRVATTALAVDGKPGSSEASATGAHEHKFGKRRPVAALPEEAVGTGADALKPSGSLPAAAPPAPLSEKMIKQTMIGCLDTVSANKAHEAALQIATRQFDGQFPDPDGGAIQNAEDSTDGIVLLPVSEKAKPKEASGSLAEVSVPVRSRSFSGTLSASLPGKARASSIGDAGMKAVQSLRPQAGKIMPGAKTALDRARVKLNAETAGDPSGKDKRRVIKKENKKARLANPFSSKAKQELSDQQSRYERFVMSRTVEMCSLGLVFTNAVFIGGQVQYMALYHDPIPFQDNIEYVFVVAFTFELTFRYVPQGRKFFNSMWNCFDSLVVLVMLVELMVNIFGRSASVLGHLSLLRTLRIARIVRVLRIIKMLAFFRELRMMIDSIMKSLVSLMWAFLVLLIVFYIFGIILTQGVVDHFNATGSWNNEEFISLSIRFGTLTRAVLSLYEGMAGGISWGELIEVLDPLGPAYVATFLFFISFAVFAVLNVVAAVFVETAMQSSAMDRESVIQDEMMEKEDYVKKMQRVFQELDANESGSISISEFLEAIEDDRMVAYFNALKLDISDVQTLFVLLDRDREGSIDVDEFVLGCMQLRGEASSLDMAKLVLESEYTLHNVETLVEGFEKLRSQVATLCLPGSPSAPTSPRSV